VSSLHESATGVQFQAVSDPIGRGELLHLHSFGDNAGFGSARYDARLSGAGTSLL